MIRNTPGTWDVHDSWGVAGFQLHIDVDEDRANLAGVTNANIAQTLNAYFTGHHLTTFRERDHLVPPYLRLPPEQPASLIHGDLWSGNAIAGPEGEPAIIDPAAHYGWAEAELGMTNLFGGFPEAFYKAYEEVAPLVEGWRDRLPIYNLYHLLNHVNLFGAGYLGQVRSILQRFG